MVGTRTGRPKSRTGSRTRYVPKRKFCPICSVKSEVINYKESGKLRRYISDRGKIVPRRRSGVCAKHQRALAIAIKRARHLALLPYTSAHIRQTGGVGVRA